MPTRRERLLYKLTGEPVTFTARPNEVQEHVKQASLYSINRQPPPSAGDRLTEGQELYFMHAWYE